ncbi:MAG: hypothetical protein A2W03_07905 [Candidatus Aminicenantes bacterium RBG_16_63_16]|nr:MAG: hypothetical protein A2W03_07905 [Candidatus Aminicenantes bacterium RBG_16_63_16]
MASEATEAAPARDGKSLRLILLLSVVLNLAALWWGLPAHSTWAADEIQPSRVLAGLDLEFSRGWHEKYPPLHYYLLTAAYSPALLLDKLGVLDIRELSGYTLLIVLGRLLSLAMAAGCVLLVYKCGREILDRRAAVSAALITALLAPFVYYAKMANLEVPYLFWFLASLYFYLRLLSSGRTRDYVLFALTAVLAVGSKDQAAALYGPAPFLMFWATRRRDRRTGPSRTWLRALIDRRHLLAAAAAAASFALVNNIVFNWSGFLNHLRLVFDAVWQGYQMVPASVAGQMHLFVLTVRELAFCLTWPLLLVCAGGVFLAVRERPRNSVLLTLPLFGLSYYVFYIALIRYNYDRFNLPLCILLSFFGGKAISAALAKRPARLLKLLAAAVFVFAFLRASSVDLMMLLDGRYHVERWMRQYIPADAKISVPEPTEYLPRLENLRYHFLTPYLPEFREKPKPDFIIFSTIHSRSHAPDTPEARFFARFMEQPPKYRLVLKHRTRFPWLPLDFESVPSNLNKINPEILVYKKNKKIDGAAAGNLSR